MWQAKTHAISQNRNVYRSGGITQNQNSFVELLNKPRLHSRVVWEIDDQASHGGCMVGGFRMLRIIGLPGRCWGNRLWPNGKLHESVAYKRADMSLFFPQWTVWGGVGGWERWHPGPHVSLLQSRLPFPQSLSSFHFCPLWFKESTFSRTELPKQNNYVVNGKCLGMTAKAFKSVATHEVNVNVCLCASKRSAWLPNLMPWPRDRKSVV